MLVDRCTNGPLGEIFDHGCDAFSTVFVLIAYGIATDLGPTLGLFTLCCLGNFLFYAAHWQTLVSGVLNFGRFDVTEAQLFLISVHIWTGLFGAGLWNYELIEGFPIKYMMLASSTICSFGSFITSGNAATILTGGSGKNGATIADTSVLSPGIPVLLLSGMFWKLMTESPSQVFENNAVLFVLTMGLAFTKITNSLVIADSDLTTVMSRKRFSGQTPEMVKIDIMYVDIVESILSVLNYFHLFSPPSSLIERRTLKAAVNIVLHSV
eukprot:sb/3468250/